MIQNCTMEKNILIINLHYGIFVFSFSHCSNDNKWDYNISSTLHSKQSKSMQDVKNVWLLTIWLHFLKCYFIGSGFKYQVKAVVTLQIQYACNELHSNHQLVLNSAINVTCGNYDVYNYSIEKQYIYNIGFLLFRSFHPHSPAFHCISMVLELTV